jgi:hypothetical protein
VFVTANLRLVPSDFAGALAAISKPFSETAFRQALRYLARRLRGAAAPSSPERLPPPSLALAPGPAGAGGDSDPA